MSERKTSSPLTAKQKEVVEYLSHGKTVGEIAIILGVKDCTVRARVEKVVARTGINRNIQIVAKALREGWIE